MDLLIIIFTKFISWFSQTFNLGNGSTWPGHIILKIRPSLFDLWHKQCKNIIVVTGTNGKTTTSKMIRTALDNKVIHNESGANLLNGLTSAFLTNSNIIGKLKFDTAVFEVDENTLPKLVNKFKPNIIVCLNLFRDQLDRYGEIETIANKWQETFKTLPKSTSLIINADDPLTVNSTKDTVAKVYYFGIEQEKVSSRINNSLSDMSYCPRCEHKLNYEVIYCSHLGKWSCSNCNYSHPKLDYDDKSTSIRPIEGLYNVYNLIAAYTVIRLLGFSKENFEEKLKNFQPGFGRGETFKIEGKQIKLLLSKNPAGLNMNLQLLKEQNDIDSILFVLNDQIPDGRDVSWIWDTDLESLKPYPFIVSGNRSYDMAVRLKYSEIAQTSKFKIEQNLNKAVRLALKDVKSKRSLYILANYSAMLEVRKILTGRKIL